MQGDKPVSGRRFLGYITAGLRATVPTLDRQPIWVWLTGAIVIVVAGLLTMLLTEPVSAAPEEKAPLDCLSCHTRVLQSHDILGSGSAACWVCHDSINIGMLRLADGTQFPLVDSPQLCGQCHTKRYQAWQEGTHGILSGKTELEFLGDQKLKCISCHNPHQPKIDLTKLRTPSALPVSEPGATLDCLSCHARILVGHDKLGEGSEACRACHSSTQMGVLHLAGGETLLSLSDSLRLCAQCHQKRYEDWTQGTHGMPSGEMGIVEIHSVQKVGCISCHDPHQPQVVLLGITKPHPAPAPSPPPPPVELLLMLGIALLLTIGIGVVVATRGKGL